MSKSLPFWKIKRELARPFKQLSKLHVNVSSYLFSTLYYDAIVSKEQSVSKGELEPSEKIAIFVIFPNDGLLRSHINTLQYLKKKGFTALVISNLPLEQAEKDKLLPLCWELIERPNYGYDFGGYRDGVLRIQDRLKSLGRLVILNDSCWFPYPDSGDWIDDADSLQVDYAGAASNYGTPRALPTDWTQYQWSYRTDHRNFHYCSFALSIGPNILRDPGFLHFWNKFPMTQQKDRVVRRGEIGLSQWVIKRGYTHAATLDSTTLDKKLAELSDERLNDVAKNIIIPEDPRFLKIKHDILTTKPSRPVLINFILVSISRQGSSYTLADYSIHEGKWPFLKKSPLWLHPESSEISLKLINNTEHPTARIIEEEAKVLAARCRQP